MSSSWHALGNTRVPIGTASDVCHLCQLAKEKQMSKNFLVHRFPTYLVEVEQLGLDSVGGEKGYDFRCSDPFSSVYKMATELVGSLDIITPGPSLLDLGLKFGNGGRAGGFAEAEGFSKWRMVAKRRQEHLEVAITASPALVAETGRVVVHC